MDLVSNLRNDTDTQTKNRAKNDGHIYRLVKITGYWLSSFFGRVYVLRWSRDP